MFFLICWSSVRSPHLLFAECFSQFTPTRYVSLLELCTHQNCHLSLWCLWDTYFPSPWRFNSHNCHYQFFPKIILLTPLKIVCLFDAFTTILLFHLVLILLMNRVLFNAFVLILEFKCHVLIRWSLLFLAKMPFLFLTLLICHWLLLAIFRTSSQVPSIPLKT